MLERQLGFQEKYDINAPELPRKRKPPAHFKIDSHVKTYLRSTMTRSRLH